MCRVYHVCCWYRWICESHKAAKQECIGMWALPYETLVAPCRDADEEGTAVGRRRLPKVKRSTNVNIHSQTTSLSQTEEAVGVEYNHGDSSGEQSEETRVVFADSEAEAYGSSPDDQSENEGVSSDIMHGNADSLRG